MDRYLGKEALAYFWSKIKALVDKIIPYPLSSEKSGILCENVTIDDQSPSHTFDPPVTLTPGKYVFVYDYFDAKGTKDELNSCIITAEYSEIPTVETRTYTVGPVTSEQAFLLTDIAQKVDGTYSSAWYDDQHTMQTVTIKGVKSDFTQPLDDFITEHSLESSFDTTDSTPTLRFLTNEKQNSVTITPAGIDDTWRGAGKSVILSVYRITVDIMDKQSVAAAGFASGSKSIPTGKNSHAEGSFCSSTGLWSHAEGREAIASGKASHAEGVNTTAYGKGSHAEGNYYSNVVDEEGQVIHNIAYGYGSHAEGCSTRAMGDASHAEGVATLAKGTYSSANGYYSQAAGLASHAFGVKTQALKQAQFVVGQWNKPDSDGKYMFLVGTGGGDKSLKTGFAVSNGGNIVRNDEYGSYIRLVTRKTSTAIREMLRGTNPIQLCIDAAKNVSDAPDGAAPEKGLSGYAYPSMASVEDLEKDDADTTWGVFIWQADQSNDVWFNTANSSGTWYGDWQKLNAKGTSRVFEQVLNATGTVKKGTYNFSKTIEIKPGDVFLVETIRENAFSYQNIIVAKGDSTTEIIMCVPMGNSGANIFAQVTITATALSVNTDWYSGYEYTGILSQTLCTGIRVWHISY